MTEIISFINQKGGVGKTTLAVNLSAGLALSGKTVLVVDFDPQGQVSTFLGEKGEVNNVFTALLEPNSASELIDVSKEHPSLHLLRGGKRTAAAQTVLAAESAGHDYVYNMLRKIRTPDGGRYDYIVLDTSPSLGPLQDMATWASRRVFAPTKLESASLDGLNKYLGSLEAHRRTRGWEGFVAAVIPTFYDERAGEGTLQLTRLHERFGDLVSEPIHATVRFVESVDFGVSMWKYVEQKRDKYTIRAIRELADLVWLVKQLEAVK